ncbi:conjugal transfer protein [bacterium D16-76]|nr:conjugal transfer protein [bacterium D16-76]
MDKKKEEHWIHCPICRTKTHTKVNLDTVLLNFPLYCPKCKRSIQIGVINLKMVVNNEPGNNVD